MGLTERIEAWPEAMKAARLRVAEAEGAYAEVELELSQAGERHGAMLESNSGYSHRPSSSLASVQAERQRMEDFRRQLLEAEEATRNAQDELIRVKASADVQIRREADAGGKRLTESAIRALVTVHPDVAAAEQRWRDAQAKSAAARLDSRRAYGVYSSAFTEEADDEAEGDAEIVTQAQLALATHIQELKQRRVSILSRLEVARAEVTYQKAVGKSLAMLTSLEAASRRAQ